MGLPLQARVERTVHAVETDWLSNKEKIPCTVVSKEGHADSLLGHERNHRNFLEKVVTINSASYFQLLR